MGRITLFAFAIVIWCCLEGQAHAGSTIVPTQPPLGQPYNAAPIQDNFQRAAADINNLPCNPGTSPPANPTIGTCWLNTPTNSRVFPLNFWDGPGNAWVTVGAFDSVNHIWQPPVGGGIPPNLLSASTTDLGSVAQAAINVTGNNTIHSFGASAPIGAVKFLTFAGSPTVTYNATSLITDGAANLVPTAGDAAIVEHIGGPGNWKVLLATKAGANLINCNQPGQVLQSTSPGPLSCVTLPLASNASTGLAQCDGTSTSCQNGIISAVSQPTVATNAALQALPLSKAPQGIAYRAGFSASGDGGDAYYIHSSTACSLNSGAGDNGSQVGASDGGCWNASFSSPPSIKVWGAKVDGATDDAAAVQSAYTWATTNNGALHFAAGATVIGSQITATLASNGQSPTFFGDGPGASLLKFTGTGGLKIAGSANQTSVHFRDMAILSAAPSNGVGIDLEWGSQHNNTNQVGSTSFDHIVIGGTSSSNYWTAGIKLNGISEVNLNGVDFEGPAGSSCGAALGIGLLMVAPSNNLSFIYNVVNSNFAGWQYGIEYGSYTQGLAIANSNFPLNCNGIYMPASVVGIAQLSVVNSQFDNYGDNILLDTGGMLPQALISNNLFYVEPATAGFHAIGETAYSTFVGNQCSSATNARIAAQCVRLSGNGGRSLVSDTMCNNLEQCVLVDGGSSGVMVVRCRLINNGVGDLCATNTTSSSTNVVVGFNYDNTSTGGMDTPLSTAVTAAADNGSGLIRLTVASTAGFTNGQTVFVNAPGLANTPAIYNELVVDSTHFDLLGSAFSGSLSADGTVSQMP